MNPVISIIHYLFNKQNIINNDDSIYSFFKNGVAFPLFVKLAYNEDIPKIVENPNTRYLCKANNRNTSQFLISKNIDIANTFHNLETDQDKLNILKYILTEKCFTNEPKDILSKVNAILAPLDIQYDEINEMLNLQCLVSLVQVLASDSMEENTEEASFHLISNILKKYNVPLVINEDSLNIQNRSIFFIQIEIICATFPEKVEELMRIDAELDEELANLSLSTSFDNTPTKKENDTGTKEPEKKETNSDTKEPEKKETNPDSKQPEKKQPNQNSEELKKEQNKNKIDIDLLIDQEMKKQDMKDENMIKIDDLHYISSDDDEIDQETQDLLDEMKLTIDINSKKTLKKHNFELKPDDKNIFPKKDRKKSLFRRSNRQEGGKNLNDEALLRTINEIVKDKDIKFDHILELIDQDFLPRIVRIFFTDEKDLEALTEIIETKNVHYTVLINKVIKFLGKKDPIFKILVLDFTTRERIESSIFTFYVEFLRRFFLKKTKEEFAELTSQIIFSNEPEKIDKFKNDLNYEKRLIFDLRSFHKLAYFASNHSMINYEKHLNEDATLFFNQVDIPSIIDQRYFESKYIIEPSLFYFQLQFIFDSIEKQSFFQDNLQMIISRKNNFFNNDLDSKKAEVIQKGRYQQYLIDRNINKIDEKESKIKHEKYLIQKPQTFLERKKEQLNDYSDHAYEEEEEECSNTYVSPEHFWNPTDSSYKFEEGILFKKKKKTSSMRFFSTNIKNYEEFIKRVDSASPVFKFDCEKNDLTKGKLYKFFYYNEKERKWQRNMKSFGKFVKNMKSQVSKPQISLVFFSNSNEKDMIHITSQLISFTYPDLDDDQIYVYGFCDKSLTSLEYEYNTKKGSIKPLFLLLHVPESKKKLKNIHTIIYQINFFLSMICDIEIVILNKERYADQIKMINNMSLIPYSYFDEEKSQELVSQYSTLKESLVASELKVYTMDSSDGDEIPEEEEENNDIIESYFINSNDVFSKMTPGDFKKEKDFIILVNEENIKGDFTCIEENPFFNTIKSRSGREECKVHYININETSTYRDFLTSLNESASKSNSSFQEAMNSFSFIQAAEVSGMYLSLKSQEKYFPNLEKIIYKRFNQIKNCYSSKLSGKSLLSTLQKEISNAVPSVDYDFVQSCRLIYEKIKKSAIEQNAEICFNELRTSAQNYLAYYRDLIKNGDFWTNEKKDSIKNRYASFIRNEFYEIIKYFYPQSEYLHGYEANQIEVETTINEDLMKIDKFFEDFEKAKKSKGSLKTVDMDEEMKKATNYMIRETENIRELKVIVETGELNKKIPQDF